MELNNTDMTLNLQTANAVPQADQPTIARLEAELELVNHSEAFAWTHNKALTAALTELETYVLNQCISADFPDKIKAWEAAKVSETLAHKTVEDGLGGGDALFYAAAMLLSEIDISHADPLPLAIFERNRAFLLFHAGEYDDALALIAETLLVCEGTYVHAQLLKLRAECENEQISNG